MGGFQHSRAPSGRLIPIFASEGSLSGDMLAYNLARAAANRGDNVLIVDCDQGRLLNAYNIQPKANLDDVLSGDAELEHAINITRDGAMALCSAGKAPLTELLGALAAMSLSHDWVFVLPAPGCTPAHVRLASAADSSIMMFHSAGDQFMRAYWMLDAIRTRAPKYDPLMVSQGPADEADEAYDMFSQTVREFLGAPPCLAGRVDEKGSSLDSIDILLEALESADMRLKAA